MIIQTAHIKPSRIRFFNTSFYIFLFSWSEASKKWRNVKSHINLLLIYLKKLLVVSYNLFEKNYFERFRMYDE